jgi:hypothetical protein
MKRKIISIFFLLILAVSLAFAFTTTGPKLPTAATGNTNTIGGGVTAWTNPTNIELADSVDADVLPGTPFSTQDLRGGGFGFAIASTDTINGIILEVNAQTPTTNNIYSFHTVALEGGGGASANKAAGSLTTTATTFSFGGSSDLWGTTWTPAQINSGSFVGNVSFSAASAGGHIFVDYMRITVTSTPASNGSGFLKMFGYKIKPPQPHTQTRTFGLR